VRLLHLAATPHPAGNRIDLSWTNPSPAQFPGVRVVGRLDTHPLTPDDGRKVAEGSGLTSAVDDGLRDGTVYYYALFPFAGSPPAFDVDPHNRVSAMATGANDLAGLMYDLLPAIYRRYDASLTPPAAPGGCLAPADAERGVLRRFLDLPGSQLDQLLSFARSTLDLGDPDRVDPNLLPLLAAWIGWRTDFGLPVASQRGEIRFAPRLYQAVGIVPAVEATVKRITGWESRTKEFVHNVARTNQPERLNLWSATRPQGGGAWGTPQLASVNFVYEGRPAAVREADGSSLVVYHVKRPSAGWDLWAKRLVAGQWQPSGPLVAQPGIDKHPTAALQGARLWLFWEHVDPEQAPANRRWQVQFRTRTGGTWSPTAVFVDDGTERRLPAATVDGSGGLWLFWLQRGDAGWQVAYNRHDGTDWQLATPALLPLDGGADPRVEDDLFAIAPPGTARKVWLFWARHDPGGPAGQTRWTVAFRAKQGLDPKATDWSPVQALAKPAPGGDHDREPAALAAGANLELFWSSTRGGGWSVFRAAVDGSALTVGAPEQVTDAPYAERAPLPVDGGAAGTVLAYRSNASVVRTSQTYGAMRMLDARFAGATTVDTRDKAKLALRGAFEDFLTYTYDAGEGGVRTNDDRIARDTIGLYLTVPAIDQQQVDAAVDRLAGVLTEFLPVSDRAVFIREAP